jgi:hypothetical protein
MRYHALACDYDNTLAHDGKTAEEAESIEREADELSAEESRARVRELIDHYCTHSASPPLPMPRTDAASAWQQA